MRTNIVLEIGAETYNTQKRPSLTPYVTQQFANFNFTFISTQRPQAITHLKFVHSNNETLIIPEKQERQCCQNVLLRSHWISSYSQCAEHVFSIECSATNKTNSIRLSFENAVVNLKCIIVTKFPQHYQAFSTICHTMKKQTFSVSVQQNRYRSLTGLHIFIPRTSLPCEPFFSPTEKSL